MSSYRCPKDMVPPTMQLTLTKDDCVKLEMTCWPRYDVGMYKQIIVSS